MFCHSWRYSVSECAHILVESGDMKYTAMLLLASAAYGQHHYGRSYKGGVQTLQSSPLPPHGYVSPSALRERSEPPKPFAYKYEGPDPYGGYSSHESQGDEYGRITGQYTVQNPDGTSRLVKYIADPELGFHAEVDTDETGTKTSEPAGALIRSSAPEEDYNPQVRQMGYGARAPAPYTAPVYKSAPHLRPPASGRPRAYGVTPSVGGSLKNYRSGSQYSVSGAFKAPAPYKASATYNAAPTYGASATYNTAGSYRAPAAYGAPVRYGSSGAYRGTSNYGTYKAAASYRIPAVQEAPRPTSYSHRQLAAPSKRSYY